jgi:hypothetical protein
VPLVRDKGGLSQGASMRLEFPLNAAAGTVALAVKPEKGEKRIGGLGTGPSLKATAAFPRNGQLERQYRWFGQDGGEYRSAVACAPFQLALVSQRWRRKRFTAARQRLRKVRSTELQEIAAAVI